MRVSPKWMVLLDDRILEYLREEGPHSPSEIASDDRIPYGATYVGRRCRKLQEHGLARSVGRGTYIITELGEQYLNEELPMECIEEQEQNEGTAET